MERAEDFGWRCERVDTRREFLVQKYHYLCRRGARKYARRAEDFADFEQTAALGLIKAVDRYRGETGTPFEAYAWIMIQGELSHYVRDVERILRAPRRLRSLDRRWRDTDETLRQSLNREPTDGEVAASLLLDSEAIREIREYRERGRIESLDTLAAEATSRAYYTMDEHDDRLVMEEALRSLTSLERCILIETIDHDQSVVEVARKLGYSERHISRIRRNALQKLSPLGVLAGAYGGY